ncbi:MAG TPA: hypothetical protein VG268_20565 [Streptosporangiaceae bacterium]|jgi:hypothetical protein|nr:hypothetical protein [Streptosporangiaceae bacterium]
MHGMLSAAILVIVFVLVAAAGGVPAVWLYRAASSPGGRSRPPRGTAPASPVTETESDDQAPVPEIENVEQPLLALPAPAEHSGPAESSVSGPAESAEPPVAGEPAEGARIYVLDSSRRPSP